MSIEGQLEVLLIAGTHGAAIIANIASHYEKGKIELYNILKLNVLAWKWHNVISVHNSTELAIWPYALW